MKEREGTHPGSRSVVHRHRVRRLTTPIPPRATPHRNFSAARLTVDQVHQIRRLLAQGLTDRQIARRIPISAPTIRDIRVGKTWAWLKEDI